MTNIYKKYKGKWIALQDDEQTVISSGKSLVETAKKAEKKVSRILYLCRYLQI